jgi:hypothetical protein
MEPSHKQTLHENEIFEQKVKVIECNCWPLFEKFPQNLTIVLDELGEFAGHAA